MSLIELPGTGTPGTGTIETISVGLDGLEQLLRRTILDELGEDKECLRSLEVKPYIAKCAEEAADIALTKGILSVQGFLSLDGHRGKMLDMLMEVGLTDAQDRDIATQLADQCVACVELLQIEEKQGTPIEL
jgi:hypothetical protein